MEECSIKTTHHQTFKASAVGHCTASKVSAVQRAEEVFMEAVPWVFREPTFKKKNKRLAVQQFFPGNHLRHLLKQGRMSHGCPTRFLSPINDFTDHLMLGLEGTCGDVWRFLLDLVDLCLWVISVHSTCCSTVFLASRVRLFHELTIHSKHLPVR